MNKIRIFALLLVLFKTTGCTHVIYYFKELPPLESLANSVSETIPKNENIVIIGYGGWRDKKNGFNALRNRHEIAAQINDQFIKPTDFIIRGQQYGVIVITDNKIYFLKLDNGKYLIKVEIQFQNVSELSVDTWISLDTQNTNVLFTEFPSKGFGRSESFSLNDKNLGWNRFQFGTKRGLLNDGITKDAIEFLNTKIKNISTNKSSIQNLIKKLKE
jgi:hypothetical protein